MLPDTANLLFLPGFTIMLAEDAGVVEMVLLAEPYCMDVVWNGGFAVWRFGCHSGVWCDCERVCEELLRVQAQLLADCSSGGCHLCYRLCSSIWHSDKNVKLPKEIISFSGLDESTHSFSEEIYSAAISSSLRKIPLQQYAVLFCIIFLIYLRGILNFYLVKIFLSLVSRIYVSA